MQESIYHWNWEIDKPLNFFSLFVLEIGKSDEYAPEWHGKRLIYYTHAQYKKEDNIWHITSQRTLPAMMCVVHQGFCYGKYHNINTDFDYGVEVPVDGVSKLEDMVSKLCHNHEAMQHITHLKDRVEHSLWYPDDLVKWLSEVPDAHFQAWMIYIEQGKNHDGNGNG